MTRKQAILEELATAPPRHVAAPLSPPPCHVPVEIRWEGPILDLKPMMFESATDFRSRWFLARLPSGLRVGVQRTADGPHIVRLTVNGVATPSEQAEGRSLMKLWGLGGWTKTTEKAAVEHRITWIEPEVAE